MWDVIKTLACWGMGIYAVGWLSTLIYYEIQGRKRWRIFLMAYNLAKREKELGAKNISKGP